MGEEEGGERAGKKSQRKGKKNRMQHFVELRMERREEEGRVRN